MIGLVSEQGEIATTSPVAADRAHQDARVRIVRYLLDLRRLDRHRLEGGPGATGVSRRSACVFITRPLISTKRSSRSRFWRNASEPEMLKRVSTGTR